MNLDAISQIIIAAAPAITAVITAIVSLAVSIKKVKSTSEATIKEIRENNKNLKEENLGLKHDLRKVEKQNSELKDALEEVLARMKHMYFVEKPEHKEE